MKLMGIRKCCAFLMTICVVIALFFSVGVFVGSLDKSERNSFGAEYSASVDATEYYYEQLIRNDSRLEQKFYRAIEKMWEDGDLKSGNASIDLVNTGFLSQNDVDTYANNSMTLLYAFGAGRDAFYLDHPEVFYVNFDKMSIRTLSKSGKNYAFLGTGRGDSYIADGDAFNTAEKVETACTNVKTTYSELLTSAKAETNTIKKIRLVYDFVRGQISYATELTCTDANINYVRNPYALVTREGVCEAYARSFKIIMDELDIPCVSVVGMYNEYDSKNELSLSELHMWNYVLVGDVWYLIDTTMDSGKEDSECQYFLAGYGTTGASHVPDSVISQSNYSFRYPELCNSQYQISNSFTMTEVEQSGVNYVKVAYKGMNAQQLYEKGMYYAVKYNDADWTALTNYTNKLNCEFCTDTADGLLVALDGDFTKICIGVTKTNATTTTTILAVDIIESSQVYENLHRVESTHRPFPISVTPKNTEVLRSGKTYNVTLIFDEMLKEVAGTKLDVDVTHNAGVLLDDIKISDVVWDGQKTVTCKFTTSQKYAANTCTYYLTVKGLVSMASGRECMSANFFVLNQTNVGCPLKWGQTYEIYGKPQLMESPDIDTSSWILSNGETVNKNLSNGVALVVNESINSTTQTTISNGIGADLNKTNQTVLASKTYDVSLTLCGQQVKNLSSVSGKRVKIMLPFPDGYSGKETGVTFVAYHYNSSSGAVEKVDCLINENGIVIFCNSFSPYTIVATQKPITDVTKKVVVLAHDGGTITAVGSDNPEFCVLQKDGTQEFQITLNAGYVVDYVRINGKDKTVIDNNFSVSYNEIKDNSVVEAFFVNSEIKDQESEKGYAEIIPTATAPRVTITRNVNRLNAVVSGVVGKLSYQWYIDGEKIEGATDSYYSINEQNKDKVYTVEVTNSVLSSSATAMSEPYQSIQDNTVLIVVLMLVVVALLCVVGATMLIRHKNAKNANKVSKS